MVWRPGTGLPKWLLAGGNLAWLHCSQKERLKFPCSRGGSRRRPGQVRSQGTLGTLSECLEGDLGLILRNPRGSSQPTLPPWPQACSDGTLPVPGDNLPTGLAPGKPAQLPLQRLPSSSSLLHCPRGEKNSPEPAGTVPKFSFLAQSPGKPAKSSREGSFPLSPSLPLTSSKKGTHPVPIPSSYWCVW